MNTTTSEGLTADQKSAMNTEFIRKAEAKLVFTSTEAHTLVAGEGGRIELSGDNRGNVTVHVIAEEGYVFDGWTTEDGAFTSSGNVKITAKTTFTANFKKK